MTKYHENLLGDNTLSNISTEKKIFILGSPHDAENPKWNLFIDHPIYNYTWIMEVLKNIPGGLSSEI